MTSQKVFAIGDIHGCADELNTLISTLPLDKNSTIIFLGDYIDRGPNSKKVIETIIELGTQYNVIPLMGNHEAMLLEFLSDPSSSLAAYFILNGGSATLASYVSGENEYEIPKEHLSFFKNLKLFYQTENYFFVHAGVPNVRLSKINEKDHRNDLLWIRESFFKSWFQWGKVIVHGHSPRDQVEITRKRINLDTGCIFNGMLSAMEVNSRELFQVKSSGHKPHVFLKENPQISRVAKRFLGTIPVYVETPNGYEEFSTVNYNQFGLLIVDQQPHRGKVFEVGQVLTGKIGTLDRDQIKFTGQVVRHAKRGNQLAYGIKMIEPLGKNN